MRSRDQAHRQSSNLICWTWIPGRDPPGRRGPPATRALTSYLQYTSGSTRTPAGVAVSSDNVFANFEQIMGDYFANEGGVPPAGG